MSIPLPDNGGLKMERDWLISALRRPIWAAHRKDKAGGLRFAPGACVFCAQSGDLLEEGLVVAKLYRDAESTNGQLTGAEIAAHDLCMARTGATRQDQADHAMLVLFE